MSQHIYTYDPTNGLEEITGTGHVIQDSNGTSMPVRSNMKIVNAMVTDDAANDATVLNMTGAIIDDTLSTTSENPVQNKVITVPLNKTYKDDDTTEATLADGDYFPFYDTSAGGKRKSLWSNIVAKIKAALGIASSGTTFLRKDGTWATPTNTTYTFATGDSNGQIKVTPSGGTAQNVSVKGLGSAAYTASSDYAVSKKLTNENLNNVTTPGFYNAGGDNACTNTGFTSGTAFGLEVVHLAVGSYYLQVITPSGTSDCYRRNCNNGTWSSWTKDNYTNTWRGIQNNLTSSGNTTDSLGAGQGYLLANGSARDSTKVAKAGDTMTGNLTIDRQNGTAGSAAWSYLNIGNNIATSAAKNSTGVLRLYSGGTSYVEVAPATTNSAITQTLQAKAGTIALTSQLTDGSVTKVGTATKGGANTPVYLSSGTPTACNSFVPTGGGSFRRTDGTPTIVYIGSDDSGYKGSGRLRIYAEPKTGTTRYYANLLGTEDGYTSNHNFYFPDEGGTIQTGSGSSRRIKENIRDMTEEEAQKILDVSIVKFDYKGDWCGGKKNQSGVIAEDMIDIIPEAVHVPKSYDPSAPVDEEHNMPPEVDYRKFVPYLIKMVQMQQKEIEELKETIKSLKEG